jgi:hypothetical protein
MTQHKNWNTYSQIKMCSIIDSFSLGFFVCVSLYSDECPFESVKNFFVPQYIFFCDSNLMTFTCVYMVKITQRGVGDDRLTACRDCSANFTGNNIGNEFLYDKGDIY